MKTRNQKSRNQRSMTRKLGLGALALAGLALVLVHKGVPRVWARTGSESKPVLINQAIDENQLISVGGTRREANAKNDRGRVEDSFPMEHMLLQLKRAPNLEREFDQYIDSLTDKRSPNFHHWIMAAEQGEKYSLAQQDIDSITGFLRSHGFTIDSVYPNRMVIEFSGTAGEIREAFHTEIHYLEVRGEQHFANMSDPQIPRALAPAVVGVVSMHNFKPQQMRVPRVRSDYTFSGCGGHCYSLVPADFQTIYNLNPLYQDGINGKGQTITVVEDSDTYTPSGGTNDVIFYRNTFLSKWSGTVTTVHPAGSAACTDPGTNEADGEADLDAEVASAIAPNAAIEVAACADTTTFGGLLAIENLVNSATPPAIISQSYGVCEAANFLPSNAAFYTAFQTAAAAGTSVFVSAGDAGGAACAPEFHYGGSHYAYSGIGVTGWGETPYNVAVGGTDFEDAYNAKEVGTPVSTYWSSTNTATDGSAKSYIPEIPWNDSCAGYLLYNYEGFTAPYGTTGFCNSTIGKADFLSTAAGGGGPSGCATGGGGTNQTSYLEVDGTCTGYPKPSWQSGIFGNPADGVRDVPDVSLFAANGLWGHYATICWSDPTYKSDGSAPCSGAPSTWSGLGGTSVAAPMMAAIQALVNEKWGTSWQTLGGPRSGNPNPIYYQIAKAEFGATGNSSCYSINQPPRRGLASSCVFYDITQGDNDVDCRADGAGHRVGCYVPSSTNGSIGTQALTTGTIIASGSGYTSAPTCTLGAPSNLNKYLSPTNTTIWAGGTQATCTATISGGTVTGITFTNTGQGYTGGMSCTLTGGGGSGATCSASPSVGTAASAYQPAYGATPGWDFATGLGSVNAYNLVFNSAWNTLRTDYTLTVTVSGSGGSISSSPLGISSCTSSGGTCSASYSSGTVVTLTETPSTNYYFSGWSGGGCSGTATTCAVTMSAAEAVTATFAANCPSPTAVGPYTFCNEAYNDVTSSTTSSVTLRPAPGNGVEVFAQYCNSSASCGVAPTQTATIGDNINSRETCFTEAPHSPYAMSNTSVPDYQTFYAWYCPSIPAGVTTFTVTTSATAGYLQLDVIEWKAGSIASSNYFESVDNIVNSDGTAGTTATVSTSGPTVNANDLITATIATCGASIPGVVGVGYTGIIVNPHGTPGHITEAKAVTSTGMQTATTTWSSGTAPSKCSLNGTGSNDTWFGIIVPLIGAK